MEATRSFEDLVKIVTILRAECPWDRSQTHESIKDNLIEEAYEAVDAIDRSDFDELKKELGDLLLHVLFHSEMAGETDRFTIEDVIHAIQQKLIHRHPHVFGDGKADDEQQVAENWETLKMQEGRESVLEGVPPHLPALIRAQRMQEKAANVGFDWDRSPNGKEQLWDKIEEELTEFREVYNQPGDHTERVTEEYGDLLFSIVNAGRFLNLQAEDALRQTNKKFQTRFRFVEQKVQESGRSLPDASLEEMEAYWQQAKQS